MSLRGIDQETRRRLKEEAARQGVSLNTLILRYIRRGVGLAETDRLLHHDLDALAGTWSEEEAEAFRQAVQGFEAPDKELWQ